MIQLHEVAVVGGGFIGSFTSWLLARKGIQVTLFEEHDKFGYPPHCTGLISISGLQRIGLYDLFRKEGIILNPGISSALFVTYRGKIFPVNLDEPIAVVLDREASERLIAEKAIDGGVQAHISTIVREISVNGDLIAIKRNSGKFRKRFSVIVDAEGAGRKLIRYLPGVDLRGLLPAFQMDVRARDRSGLLNSSTVLLYFNVPDFFSWIVPLDESCEIWRVGSASMSYSGLLRNIASSLARKFLKDIREIRRFGGLVVSNGPLKRFVWGKIVAVGDAAGQVKPTTGGGVIFGSLSAIVLSKIIESYLNKGTPLKTYQVAWKKFFGSNFQAMYLIRKTYNALTHVGIDTLARFIPSNILNNFKTDFDFQLEGVLSRLR